MVKAAEIHSHYHNLTGRSHIQETCSRNERRIIQNSIMFAEHMALIAAESVWEPHNKIEEYFRSTTVEAHEIVYQGYRTMAAELRRGTNSRNVAISCDNELDSMSPCRNNGQSGFAIIWQNKILLCRAWFDDFHDVANTCHDRDKGTILIHEMSHLVLGTNDNGGYQYANTQLLPYRQSLYHADTWALFAQAVEWERKHGPRTC